MSATIYQDWRPKTLRELFIQYQAVLLESWSHTARLERVQIADKTVKISDLHPYMKAAEKQKGAVVPKTNFLDRIYNALDELQTIEEAIQHTTCEKELETN